MQALLVVVGIEGAKALAARAAPRSRARAAPRPGRTLLSSARRPRAAARGTGRAAAVLLPREARRGRAGPARRLCARQADQ